MRSSAETAGSLRNFETRIDGTQHRVGEAAIFFFFFNGRGVRVDHYGTKTFLKTFFL